MITLPRALKSEGNPVYRGLREGSLTDSRWSWWAEDRDYAESYGAEVVEGRLPSDADIIDLTTAIGADGYVQGATLEAMIPGLADALGIDAETDIECDRLWDAAGDDLTKLADLLDANGFDGMKWVEQDRRVAYLLLADKDTPTPEAISENLGPEGKKTLDSPEAKSENIGQTGQGPSKGKATKMKFVVKSPTGKVVAELEAESAAEALAVAGQQVQLPPRMLTAQTVEEIRAIQIARQQAIANEIARQRELQQSPAVAAFTKPLLEAARSARRKFPPAARLRNTPPSRLADWRKAKAAFRGKVVPREPKAGEVLLDIKRPQSSRGNFPDYAVGDFFESESYGGLVVTAAGVGFIMSSPGAWKVWKQLIVVRPAIPSDHEAVAEQKVARDRESKRVLEGMMDR